MKIIFTAVFILLLNLTALAQVQIGNDIDGEAVDDESGWSVSMPSSNTVAISATKNNGTGWQSGHVRVYSWNGNGWIQKGADIDGEVANDHSGSSVSMPDSNTLAIGARGNDGNGNYAGHVRVYYWKVNSWVQKGADINGEAAYDESGNSLSMPDSNTVAIGAIYNDGNGASSGHVRVFTWNGSSWVQKGLDIDGEAGVDYSSSSVSMPDSNTVAIGAIGNDGNGSSSGHVRVFTWNGSSWVQKGADIDGEAANDYSGTSVSMPDSNTLAIGAKLNNGNGADAGHVRVFTWNGSSWIQKGIDIDGESAGDNSGWSVSLPDSNTLAIGATYNDGNGTNAGHVRVYSWTGNTWVQRGIDIDGESANDLSGWSVCMPDANRLAIGAPDNRNYTGHVRVFCVPSIKTIFPVVCDTYTSPSGNYTWSTSGNYMDTIPNTAGCDSIITVNLTIDTISTIVNIANDSLIANDTSVNYQWLDCNNNYAVISGATNRVYRPTISGNYAVALNKLGCVDTSTCNNIIVTGLQSSSIQKQTIHVYPNPTTGLFTIDSPFSYESKIYTITDINSKTVQEGLLSKQHTLVNLSELSAGIYFLRIEDKAVKIVLD